MSSVHIMTYISQYEYSFLLLTIALMALAVVHLTQIYLLYHMLFRPVAFPPL